MSGCVGCGNTNISPQDIPESVMSSIIAEKLQNGVSFDKESLFEHDVEALSFSGSVSTFALKEETRNKLFTMDNTSFSIDVFGINGEIYTLALDEIKLYTDDFVVRDGLGEVINVARGRHFAGVVVGIPNSAALLNVYESEVSGLVQVDSQPFEIVKENVESSRYLSRVSEKRPWGCGADTNQVQQMVENQINAAAVLTNCVKIFFDVHQNITNSPQFGGSVPATTAYVNSLFAAVALIYLNDPNVEVKLVLSGMQLWSTGTPYPVAMTGADGTSLANYRAYRNSNVWNGNLAQLIAFDSTFGLAGIGYVDVLCTTFTYGITIVDDNEVTSGVLSPAYPGYSWSASSVAHELGHNMGSSHTFDCVWNVASVPNQSLGGCATLAGPGPCVPCTSSNPFGPCAQPGSAGPTGTPTPTPGFTIMGYCSGYSLTVGFGDQPGAVIRSRVAAAGCLTSCAITPVANFTGLPLNGIAPQSVAFTDLSTNTPTSWSWNFGDLGTSTAQNPTHLYTLPGTYTVSLTATNSAGSNTFTRTNYITIFAAPPPIPVANFTGTPTSGNSPLLVTFTDSSTNSPTSWSWNFGDAGTSTLQNPTHSYAATGTYSVTLTATNGSGSSTPFTRTNYITVTTPAIPVANFTGTPTSGPFPLSVVFTDSSTNSPTSWLWDFGDLGTSTLQNPVHVYLSAGTFTVTLTATNGAGSSVPFTRVAYIVTTVPIPVVNFVGVPTSGLAPLTVAFTDNSTNGPSTWLWNFGDSTTSTLQNPIHVYTSPGIYTVTLTATNSGGPGTLTKTNYITVTSAPVTPVANFTGTPTSGVAPLTVTFTDLSTNAPTSWLWNFGDSTTSTLQNPVHVYASGGTYTVTLTATNSAGSNTFTRTNYITVTAPSGGPVANFTSDIVNGDIPLAVIFLDASTNNPTSWLWNFGDGTTSTLQNPSHTYTTVGIFTVSLTVTNAFGSNTKTSIGYITTTNNALVADFSGTPRCGRCKVTVAFTNLSTGPAVGYYWSFGDGHHSREQNPTHTYKGRGKYTVKLVIYDVNRNTKKMTKKNYIRVHSAKKSNKSRN